MAQREPLTILHKADGALLSYGQFAREAELVGLYDVFVSPDWRGQGVARRLCARLPALAQAEGASTGYLQI